MAPELNPAAMLAPIRGFPERESFTEPSTTVPSWAAAIIPGRVKIKMARKFFIPDQPDIHKYKK
jgi:hypothetical protein